MKNADLSAMPASMIDTHLDRNDGKDESGRYMLNMGLTKREMFAMHAPSDIPEWFLSSFNADISSIKKPSLSEHQVNMMLEYNNDNYGLSDEDFKLGGDAAKLVREYNCKCEREVNMQVYFAWKVYHANELLAELDK